MNFSFLDWVEGKSENHAYFVNVAWPHLWSVYLAMAVESSNGNVQP